MNSARPEVLKLTSRNRTGLFRINQVLAWRHLSGVGVFQGGTC